MPTRNVQDLRQDDLGWLRPALNSIPQADDLIDGLRLEISQHRIQSGAVAMNIRDYCDARLCSLQRR